MGWYNTNWANRKSLTVNGTTVGAQTNYQLQLTVNKGSGTDSAGNIYCGGKCRNDFGDIRFTQSNGTTLLNYWIDQTTLISGTSTNLYVQINSIPASPSSTNIYIYYNNSSATDASSISNTFVFGDNFEYTDSIANHGWVIAERNPVTTTAQAKTGNRSLFTTATLNVNEDVAEADVTLMNGIVEVWLYDDGNISSIQRTMAFGTSGTAASFQIGIETVDTAGFYDYWDGSHHSTGVARSNGWHFFKLTITPSGTSSSIDGTSVTTNDGSLTNLNQVLLAAHRLAPSNGYWDDFRIRKFVSPEPAWSTVGSEEPVPAILGERYLRKRWRRIYSS